MLDPSIKFLWRLIVFFARKSVLMSAVALSLVAYQAAPARAQASGKLDDPTIVAIFDAANTWDMETGQLGVSRSRNPEIREFGRMLVRDHRMVRSQGRDLAKSLNVRPTPPSNFALAKSHAQAMKKLRTLRGVAFDRAFLQNEVDFHNAVIDAVTKTLLPAIQNAQLKDLVTKVAPAFVAHRDKAQSLLNNLK
jgi:putative membrane protein